MVQRTVSPKTGTEIYFGRKASDNEYITFHLSRNNRKDLWFHARDVPGSHVLLRSRTPDREDIQLAADIAAFYSKARDKQRVPVDYCEVRHVSRAAGSPTGTVETQRTRFIMGVPNGAMNIQSEESQRTPPN